MTHLLLQGDARRLPIADKSVHMIVTSPPYWALRDYGVAGQLGLEESPDEYVASMVAVFREAWRVLRDDGTLWLNLGDSYNAYNGGAGPSSSLSRGAQTNERPQLESGYGLKCKGLKPKDLVGIPWRVALALQADGWYLRSEIIWSKPNPMPESVTDRPSKSHEYLFLLAKSERYFYDIDAVREPLTQSSVNRGQYGHNSMAKGQFRGSPTDGRHQEGKQTAKVSDLYHPLGRNKRSVWTISLRSFKGAHFATFPPALVEPCVKAGTSERGCCPACGKGWVRVTEKSRKATRPGRDTKIEGMDAKAVGNRDPERHVTEVVTVGWQPGCKCDAGDPVPCVVLDIFNGAGTTGLVAKSLGRSYVGIDLKPEYLAMSAARIAEGLKPSKKRPAKLKPAAPGQLTIFDLKPRRSGA